MSDRLSDPRFVRDQYNSESGLTTRASIWQPTAEGLTPHDVVLSKLREYHPRGLLEVGCGTGALAERIAGELPTQVTCVDQSERMVELTAGRGICALVADAGALPFDDDSYDAVLAAWMLYHVADLDQTLSEIRRVLRPGGLFVAVTNGDEHIADLLAAAGEPTVRSQFSRENGEASLRRHFDHVDADHLRTRAVADHGQASRYLASSIRHSAAQLPPYDGIREFTGAVTVFTAR
ncbi:MAG: class I SAM-dependent methyltransferase [Microlunatus sp.]|nr:class I SAM-dependent methyltransferase [Microlunatus sp.]